MLMKVDLSTLSKCIAILIIVVQLWTLTVLHMGLISSDSAAPKTTKRTPSLVERQKAYDYLSSIHSLQRNITFLHIPKTAGTAIEELTGVWGSCLFKHKPKRPVCKYPGKHDWPKGIAYWHLPLHVFPIGNATVYPEAEVFAVLRHPYERAVSEFYYICMLADKPWRRNTCQTQRLLEPEYLNEWMLERIQKPDDNGHWTRQHDFIIGPHQVRYVDHVLDMERLNEQVPPLLSQFGIQISHMPKVTALGSSVTLNGPKLTVDDLNATTLRALERHFGPDAKLYQQIHEQELTETT